jgi:methyl-accepting chemotaxis protein
MFKNLKVSHKIVLIIVAVAAPLVAATLFATVKGFNKDINFAEQELKGNIFQRPLAALLDALPQHQWLAEAAAGGDRAAKDLLAAKQGEIDRIFTNLDAANAKYGADLQFTEEGLAKRKRQNMDPRSVKSSWQKLKQQLPQLKIEDSAEQHKQLIAAVRTMTTHAGDISNLILDPDLDSYYTMDASLIAIPQTQDRLAAIINYGYGLMRQGKITGKDVAQFGVYAALLKEGDLDRITADIDTALNEDAGFYGTSETLQKNLKEPLKSYSTACQEFITSLNGVTTNAGPVEALQFFNAGQKAHRAAYKLWRAAAMELDTLLEKRVAAIRQSLSYTLGGIGAGLIFSFILSFFVSRGITRPLASLTATTARILEGDNSARAPVEASDELGQLAGSFNQMVEARINAQTQVEAENKRLQANIQDLLLVVSDASDGRLGVRAKVSEGALGNVCDALNLMLENVGEFIANAKAASDRVATAAADITSVAQELENGEERQSKEINATSEGVKALNGQAQRVLTNCQSATQAADNARRTAEQGAKAVREVVQGMEKIRENTQANAKKIKRLGDRSMEIAGIVKVIGDISAKTDMLALNASIEAARAGEQGRGFTVVAEQVRGLADRTKTLTNQIEKLVNDIQQETAEAVAQMEAQTQEVEVGTRAAQSAGGTLENIVSVSAQSSELVAQINQAATTQASRTQEMLVTVDAINQVVAEAQIRVRETRSTSEQLAGLSAELNKRLAQFDVAAASETVSA